MKHFGMIKKCERRKRGLTIMEVIIAIGVFTLAMSILLGLLAPMLADLSEVLDADETQSIVNKVEVFLETYDNDAAKSAFQEIYEEVYDTGYLEVFVYKTIGGQTQVTSDSTIVTQAMNQGDPNLMVDRRVFLALVYASNVNPPDVRTATAAPLGGDYINIEGFRLTETYDDYPEGYLAFSVEVFSYSPPDPGSSFQEILSNNIPTEAGLLLSFPTAINR